jgi:hypothetical protein
MFSFNKAAGRIKGRFPTQLQKTVADMKIGGDNAAATWKLLPLPWAVQWRLPTLFLTLNKLQSAHPRAESGLASATRHHDASGARMGPALNFPRIGRLGALRRRLADFATPAKRDGVVFPTEQSPVARG